MFIPGDKVRIIKGMMIDMNAPAEIVGYVTYKVRILNRKDNVYREVRDDELELIVRVSPRSWPPVPDDVE